tara:strand:+ start:1788 stop:2015 length:228 start_codon:yes stop_codon:yes gene_type:complete
MRTMKEYLKSIEDLTLAEAREKELNLINELKKVRVYSFETAEEYSAISKSLMRVQQQISILTSRIMEEHLKSKEK